MMLTLWSTAMMMHESLATRRQLMVSTMSTGQNVQWAFVRLPVVRRRLRLLLEEQGGAHSSRQTRDTASADSRQRKGWFLSCRRWLRPVRRVG